MSKNSTRPSPVKTRSNTTSTSEDIWRIIDDLKKRFSSLQKEFKTCQIQLQQQQHINKKLEEKITEVILDVAASKSQIAKNDTKLREKNIIIYGMDHEEEKINSPPLQNIVNSTLNKLLGVCINSASAIRLGKSKNNKPAPVLVKLQSVEQKKTIFNNVKQLKNTPVAIQEDLPLYVRERRKILLPHFKQQQQQGNKVHWREDKIFVNGTYFDPTLQIPESNRASYSTFASSSSPVQTTDNYDLKEWILRREEQMESHLTTLNSEPDGDFYQVIYSD
jgi:hypothetical protein